MRLRADHHEGVSRGHESSDIPSPELNRDAGGGGLAGGDREPIRRAERALEPAVFPGDHQIDAHPDRVEPIRVLGLDDARNGVGQGGRIDRTYRVLV